MVTKKKRSHKDKIASIYKICNAAQQKYHFSDDKKEDCVKKIKIKWGVKKTRKKKKD